MDLTLNADTALRAYLPPQSWNGDAQHRFLFRTEDSDEEPLLSRLTVVGPDWANTGFKYCVLLRPERAESKRIFIAQEFDYHACLSTQEPNTPQQFSWLQFERNLQDSECTLSRFWLKRTSVRDIVLRVDSNGNGEILGFEDEDAHLTMYPERFVWFRGDHTSKDPGDLHFLRQTNAAFHGQIHSCSNDIGGEVNTALRWQYLTNEERHAIAFRCQCGRWDDLLSLATLALTVRVASWNRQQDQPYLWDLTSEYVLADDPFLDRWRTALIQIFQPDNVSANDGLSMELPLCIWDHIHYYHPLRRVKVKAPSHHELLEAQLQLRDWANAHFPPEEALRLLSL